MAETLPGPIGCTEGIVRVYAADHQNTGQNSLPDSRRVARTQPVVPVRPKVSSSQMQAPGVGVCGLHLLLSRNDGVGKQNETPRFVVQSTF